MSQHQRLASLQSSPVWNDFDAFYLPLLISEFRDRFPGVDPQLVEESVEDALLAFQGNPENHEARIDDDVLDSLRARVFGLMRNKLRQRYRRDKHEAAAGVLEEDFARICVSKRKRSDFISIGAAESSPRSEALDKVVSGLSRHQRAEVALLMDKASWKRWARKLEVGHLPEGEQRGLVSKEKKRLKQKIRRRMDRFGGSSESETLD
jgi:hypothetical protein